MEKWFLKSKTILGVLVAILPTLLPVFGLSFGENEQALFSEFVDAVIVAVGAVLAWIGRNNAAGTVTLLPPSS
jgi:hypothetical protein